MGSESPMELKMLDQTGNTIILKVKRDEIEITASYNNIRPHTCSIKEFTYFYSDEWKKDMNLSSNSVLSYQDNEKECKRRFSRYVHMKLRDFLWVQCAHANLVKTKVDEHTSHYVLSKDVQLLAYQDGFIVPAAYNSQGQKQNFVNEYLVRAEYNPPHERL